ncbi:MAG: LLM class flavin-dependent oxidoreductase [Acidisphaera sp.]|nr:LLM class flavin-dependent oxidoreductase [Acidisphaera sp.]
MQISYFQNIHDLSTTREYSDLLAEFRQIALACDEGGFDCFWIPEHHFSVWGRELVPNPILLAADIAARTRHCRIGLSAAIITFWHPIRLAEDLAMLDHLTGGRLVIGVGRGNYGLEASNLNPLADPNNPAGNMKVFAETLEIVKRALSQKRFSFSGEIYRFPAPGFQADRAHSVNDPAYVDPATGELTSLSIFPQALQRPHPPIWQVVSDSEQSLRFAARQDCGVLMWRPTVRELQRRLRVYRDAYQEAHGIDLPLGARTGIVRDTFVAETEQDLDVAREPLMGALNFANWRGPRIYLDPDEALDKETEAALKKRITYEFVKERSLLFGTPDQVVEKILHLHQSTGIEQLVVKCSWPGLPHEQCMRSIRLLADEVLPKVRERLAGGRAASIAAE